MNSSPPVSRIPCALIGTDGYAFELLKRILQMPSHLRIEAVCTQTPQGEGAARCRSEGIALAGDISSLLDLLPQGAVVFNPTPIPMHFESTRLCLERGFHVALEKPPVPTVQELDALAAESARFGREVSVGFNFLYSNVCRDLRTALALGRIGRLRRIRAIAAWSRSVDYYVGSHSRGRAEQDGRPSFDGALGNPLSHVLSFMLSLASQGAEEMASPVSVQAELYRSRDYVTSDDTASVRIMTDSGVELILNLTVAAAEETDPLIEIDGELGRARVEYFERAEIRPDGEPGTVLNVARESRLMMLEEIAAARRDDRPPLITLPSCRPFTVAVNASYESAGGVVLLPEEFREIRQVAGRVFDGIRGVEADLRSAHREGRLLSEGSCPWARPSPVFSCVNYTHYPAGR